jgi:O-acetyl-ADP-ribose deacetylase (regulator of RNase III)
MITEVQGDIFLADTDVIVHQANCFHTMGSGIARHIRENFPEAYEADLKTVKGDRAKVGTYSTALVTTPNPNKRLRYIVNMYSQFDFGRNQKHTLYDAIHDGFTLLRNNITTRPRTLVTNIAIPFRYGSNLGGGDWNVVKAILTSVFEDSPLTVLICDNTALTGNQLLNTVSK